jgi:hypothetical protein
MTLASDIKSALEADGPKRYPALVSALQEMNKEDRAAVLKALENESISASRLAQILNDNDWNVTVDSIRSLRRGDMKSITIAELKEMFK